MGVLENDESGATRVYKAGRNYYGEYITYISKKMGVKGKLVKQISVKTEGDVFQLYKFPNMFSEYMPDMVQSVDLLQGEWGTVGSVISWAYTQDGKKKVGREIIEAIDERKKSITFKVFEGDLLNSCGAFKIILDVDAKGDNTQLITWTLEYDKKSEDEAEPHDIMEYLINEVKLIEANYPKTN